MNSTTFRKALAIAISASFLVVPGQAFAAQDQGPVAGIEQGPSTIVVETPAPDGAVIGIVDDSFRPAAVTVSAGSTVSWEHADEGKQHAMAALDGSWFSPPLIWGDIYQRTFSEPGTYTYMCPFHPEMTGTITVTGEQAAELGIGGSPGLRINHPPYVQLGDAPLTGFPGSESDQIHIMWQTVPTGSLARDSFVVDIRRPGNPWSRTGPVDSIDTQVAGRVNHFVEIEGLDYDAEYEYRVRHLTDGQLVGSYLHSFRTRLATGDPTQFTFAAYGDSADLEAVDGFRSLQARINQVDPDFALLLGDAVYGEGSHPQADARFDASINPEATAWIAGHVDYFAFGNHDIRTDEGRPSEDNFAVPVPVAGSSAPVQPPLAERPEHNYAFDYGLVHFVTFDSNSLEDPSRLDQQLTWVEGDLAASSQPWKVVFAHHPVGGTPDKGEAPGDNYYQQVVSRLRAAGADLFLVGHSHTFGWTYPLLGADAGGATFVHDTDGDYSKGAGLVQVVSGTAGRSLREGSFDGFPFVARAFSASTIPSSEVGFALIDVTPTRMVVSYVGAQNGNVIDEFAITAGGDQPAHTVDTLALDGAVIGMVDDSFVPAAVTVSAGSTVSWEHADEGRRHAVVALDGSWSSPPLIWGDIYQRTFYEPGTYTYICPFHPDMKGTITVGP